MINNQNSFLSSIATFGIALIIVISFSQSDAFTPNAPQACHRNLHIPTLSQTSLKAVSSSQRETILRRNGEHFALNRFSGKVEFGSTANLVTKFPNSDAASIARWLSDEKRVALSIWDEELLTDLGQSTYRLEIMTLQFVTIQLAPRVDTRMWTEMSSSNIPVFKLQSTSFDPNIQILPGLSIPVEKLGIHIEVVGELRPSEDGNGVTGRIGFVSSGDLPPPMRLLPEPALRAASNGINKTVSDFAVRSFRAGAVKKYSEFKKAEINHD